MQQAFLTGPQVRKRYNISEMTLWRWLRDENLAFPKAMIIGRRKYFREEELVEWERSRARVSA